MFRSRSRPRCLRKPKTCKTVKPTRGETKRNASNTDSDTLHGSYHAKRLFCQSQKQKDQIKRHTLLRWHNEPCQAYTRRVLTPWRRKTLETALTLTASPGCFNIRNRPNHNQEHQGCSSHGCSQFYSPFQQLWITLDVHEKHDSCPAARPGRVWRKIQ
jgi:hypothetical protein